DSVECSTPHDLLIRCSLSNLQFAAIALTWCGLTSHRHRSIEPFFMSLAARDSEFRRWSGRVDRRICQTFAASPAEPGELPLGFSISPRPRLVWPSHSCHLYSRTSHDGRPHGPMVCRLRHHVHPVDGSCVNFQQDVCAGRVPKKTSKISH